MFQVNTVTNIEVFWENVFSHARVEVNGVSSDLNTIRSGSQVSSFCVNFHLHSY